MLVLAAATAAAPAYADPVPGATYTGTAADNASVTFTVSSDGTTVDSYKITGATGTTSTPGVGCNFFGAGDNGVWPGAPITNNAFSYDIGIQIDFDGTFPGAQSASGTFRFSDPATSASSACDTGVVAWTATTTATPSGGSGGGGAGGGGGGGGKGGGGSGGSGQKGKPKFATRVGLHKHGRKFLRGQVRSSNPACRADRTVTLWLRSKRIGKVKSKAGGTFSFARSAKMHGHAVRASVAARTVKSGICEAGSSTSIAG